MLGCVDLPQHAAAFGLRRPGLTFSVICPRLVMRLLAWMAFARIAAGVPLFFNFAWAFNRSSAYELVVVLV